MRLGTYYLVLARPSSEGRIGQEAVELAESVLNMSNSHMVELGAPVRSGFFHNFESESSAVGPWGELAARTKREREELGFPREHPILKRTGRYKDSWTKRGNPYHLEVVLKWRQENVLGLMIGSKDPRVGPLSGGFAAEPLLGMEGDEVGGGDGFMPPRPVHYIRPEYEKAIGRRAEYILGMMAQKVTTKG